MKTLTKLIVGSIAISLLLYLVYSIPIISSLFIQALLFIVFMVSLTVSEALKIEHASLENIKAYDQRVKYFTSLY